MIPPNCPIDEGSKIHQKSKKIHKKLMQNGKDTLSVLLNTKVKSGDKVLRVMDSSMYRDYFATYEISILPEDRQIFYSCLLAELVIESHELTGNWASSSYLRIKRDQFRKRERDVLKKLDISITHQKVKDSVKEEV